MPHKYLASLLTVALLSVPVAQARVSDAERERIIAEMQPEVREGCTVLVNTTYVRCLRSELNQTKPVVCLGDRNVLPQPVYDQLMTEFLAKCSGEIFSRMLPQLENGDDVLNTEMSFDELEAWFIEIYRPLYMQYCQQRQPEVKLPEKGSCSRQGKTPRGVGPEREA